MKRIFTFLLLLVVTLNLAEAQKGKLFIIGGGKRPESMIERLVMEAGLTDEKRYGIILPMSSSEPDSAVWYAQKQFAGLGLDNVAGMNFNEGDKPTSSQLDYIQHASMVYISGGDQNKFMSIIKDTGIREAIYRAYQNGAVIAGTSAGAAVMSEKMITGNELKYADYNATFSHIEAGNIELQKGLGLISGVIIDQHFVKRSRYNRLLSAVIEYPDHYGIGIDESTAIIVKGNNIEVIGESQVIVIKNPKQHKQEQRGLLGATDLIISIYLPNQNFSLTREN